MNTSEPLQLGEGLMYVIVPKAMLNRLIEHIEVRDYCFLCGRRPDRDRSGHDKCCPLWKPMVGDGDD